MQISHSPYSEKSSTELQRGERHNEAKIHRQHQDDQKVSKQDLVAKADTAARSDTEGRTASPVAEAAKDKDTKLGRYFRSRKCFIFYIILQKVYVYTDVPFAASMVDNSAIYV